MKRGVLRVLLGIMIGIAGGFSLTLTIFPYVTSKIFDTPTFDLGSLFSFVTPIVILWALGGAIVGWYGGVRLGGLVIGLCGALAGFLLGAVALGGDLQLTTIGILVGLMYGALGGLMIGAAFPNSINNET